jgi:hypothetical protein
MLDIPTFDQRLGGNVVYKALAHPLAAEAVEALYSRLRAAGPVAVLDPANLADALFVMHPATPPLEALYVQDVREVGRRRHDLVAQPLTAMRQTRPACVLIAAFDADRLAERIAPLLPACTQVHSLDALRLPKSLITVPARYLDRLNFATNFAFFREAGGLSTRLVTANYWAKYGAREIRLWLRLFAADGSVLATWEEPVAPHAGITIDSRLIRRRFNLPEFTGQLFIHAIGAAGHDVVKYALDTFSDAGPTLSCTHDANAWPSDRFAGLPAPRPDEQVQLWVQNSHAVPIPAGELALDRMGSERPVALTETIPPFATVPLDIAKLLPGLHWPAQIEIRSGKHLVRPRYEVIRDGRVRIAHPNVERADLTPDPAIPSLSNLLGRGYLLPFPVLPRARYRTLVQPTPMATTQDTLPLRIDLFTPEGTPAGSYFLGCLPRNHDIALDLDAVLPPETLAEGGHGELVYDFRDGGSADGWMHTLVRAEDRSSGHAAESSFGAHIYNTLLTFKDEPQSYTHQPPGLSTGLFLKLGEGRRRSFAILIYPASLPWHAHSTTQLRLHHSDGTCIAESERKIACSGSATIWPDEVFGADRISQAGQAGYVIIRDDTCRLFGYHGLMNDAGAFSLDHMFGF